MTISLKSFSQDVDLTDSTGEIKYLNYLVFLDHDGLEFRLPVPQETIQYLLKKMKSKEASEQKPTTNGSHSGVGPTDELGGDDPVPEGEEDIEEEEAQDPNYHHEDLPQSEEDVESI